MLLRFWPILLPLIAYFLWISYCRRKAQRSGKPVPAFRDGPWVLAVASSLALAILGLLYLGLSSEPNDGVFIPAHMEDGKLIPAQVIPASPAE